MKGLLFTLILIFVSTSSNAQWQQTNGPYGGKVKCILTDGDSIYAGTDSGGIYFSSNNGSSWDTTGLNTYSIFTLFKNNDTTIFAGTNGGRYRSLNYGNTWSTFYEGGPGCSPVDAFTSNGTYLFQGSCIGIKRSSNNGNSWTLVNSGLTNTDVQCLTVIGTIVFAGTKGGGIYKTTNNGASWLAVNSGITNNFINAFVVKGSDIFAATEGGGVFLSNNSGVSWTPVNSGLTYPYVRSLAVKDSDIYAATPEAGVFKSNNNGTDWIQINTGLSNLNANSIATNYSNIFIGTDGGIFISTNNGESWNAVNIGLRATSPQNVIISDSLIAGTFGDGIFISSNGLDWFAANTGLTNLNISSLLLRDSFLLAGTHGGGAFLTTNYGSSWSSINNGLTDYSIFGLANIGSLIFAGTNNGMFLSSNNGSNWTPINSGLTNLSINSLAIDGSTIFAATNEGIFYSENNGTNWSSINNGLSNLFVSSLAIKGSDIFASGTNRVYWLNSSTSNWVEITSGLPVNGFGWKLAACDSYLLAGSNYGVYITTDNGINWTSVNEGLPSNYVSSLALNGNNVIAGLQGRGVWTSQVECEPISISIQPQSQARNICSSVTFSIGINGTPSFKYKWYRNGIEIPGAIFQNYTTPPLLASDNESTYYCIITNCCGTHQITTSTATLTVLPTCKYDQPSIHLSASTVSPSENLVITGSNFTPYGEVTLSIKDESGSEVGAGIDISYPVSGGFEFILPITPAFLHGKYTIDAYDISTGISAPTTIFYVNNFTELGIKIISPNLGSVYGQGTLFDVVWTDFVGSNVENGQGGMISKSYKIEISLNGGQSWSIIWTDNHSEYAPSNEIHTFIFQNYSTYSSGTFILRITDLDDPTDFELSDPFTVYSCATGGFQASLEWDATVPDYIRNIKPNPIGLAADSTARILIKLSKSSSNDKLVSEIHGIITSNEYSTPALVGKIKYASNHLTYSVEANTASLTSEPYDANTNGNADDYWFWLVAPDDFTNNLDDEREYRQLDVQFTISYLDNTSETINLCNPIYIYRPALALAHGLDGDISTFQYCRYTNNNGGESVFDPSFVWKASKRLDLEEFGSFQTNAEILLSVGTDEDKPNENSLLKLIEKMHIMGIANKRIDYVAHSMGGVAGRTAINYGNSWYSPGVHFKNYGNGYINKFITVCTPHNGSFLADWAIDVLPFLFHPLTPGLGLVNTSAALFDNIGYITKSGNIAPAVINMQSNENGVPFSTTNVKNHLVSADIDQFDNLDEDIIIRGSKGLNKLRWLISNVYDSFHEYFLSEYGTSEFFSESDYIVQLSSQLATIPENEAVKLNDNPLGIGKTSILYGIDKFHIGIVKDLAIGNRIKTLLNAQMNSGFFAKAIPAKPLIQNNLTSDPEFISRMPVVDSVLNYIDTTKIKILVPETNQYFLVDSINDVVIKLKDTMNLQSIFLYVQEQYFESISQDSLQTFSSAVGPNILGRNLIIAIAQYDSLGIIVNHIDTISIIVGSIDSLLSLVVNPRTVNLNPTEEFQPDHQLIYSNFIALLDPGHDSLFHSIVDTNVIQYDSAGIRFIAKDTGSTYIVFSYGEYFDTTFVYISQTSNSSILNLCSLDTITLIAGTADSTKMYQWQVDSLDGFVDIYDNSYYINTNDSVLTIANPPRYWYNYRYRCIISDTIGSKVGNIYTIRFKSIWNGAIDSLWHTAGNWSCDTIPNSHIDVLIPSNAQRYPHVTENAYCRTMRLEDNAEIIIDSPNLLCVGGDDRLLCPEDIVIKLCGQNEAIVEYDISLSSSCSGTILQTSGNASGDAFAIGTTTNCFEFTDELGVIVSTCCFDVIVLEDTPPTIVCADFSVPCSEPFQPEDLIGTDTSIINVSISPNLPIGPGAGVVTEAAIELAPPVGAVIYDINVLVDIDHSWSEDLDVYIIAPDGTSVELATDVCGSTDNWADVIFDDEASISVNGACGGNPTLDGPVKPEGHLYDLDSIPVPGIWTLMITDDAGGDGGTLNTFGLEVIYTMTLPAFPDVADDCEISSLAYTDSETTGICPGYTAVNRLWTVIDNNGNSNTCNQTITFLPASLDSVTCPPTYVGSCNSYSSPGTTGYPIYNGVQIEESGLCNLFAFYSDQDTILEGYFTVLRTWTIVDTCTSLEIECIQSIISNDNEEPIITCPDSVETSCLDNIGPGVTGYPIVEDDCFITLTYADSTVIGDCISIYSTITRTWTATDDSGNTSSCEQIISLLPDDPLIICPGDLAFALEPGQNDIQVDYLITPLCSCSDSLVQTSGVESGGLFPVGTTTNCFELVDSNGVVIGSCCFDVFVYIHCLEGGITFSTQNQINLFPNEYPGCSAITGGVTINGPDITNLDSLAQIDSITQDLQIYNNSSLTNLQGLDGLQYIGSGLTINNNDALVSLSGLDSLGHIGGQLNILDNYLLQNLSGLNSLTYISGMDISGNASLVNLVGLDSVTSIQDMGANISNNIALTSLIGLNAVTSIGGLLGLNNNPVLADLSDLNNLGTIGTGLTISDNGLLTNLSGLGTVNGFNGSLAIVNNFSLSSCEAEFICDYLGVSPEIAVIYNNSAGCNNVPQVQIACGIPVTCPGVLIFVTQAEIDSFPSTYIGCSTITGGVTINGPDITNLDSLTQIDSITQDLQIYNNSSLTNLQGLDGLQYIGSGLTINNNDALVSLSGLDSLGHIGGQLNIVDNTLLQNLNGLNSLTYISGMDISGNASLVNLVGLDSVTSIQGTGTNISNNIALASLNGLNAVASIGNILNIYDNTVLSSLSALNQLNTVGYLGIVNNDALTSLSGLDNINYNTITGLTIQDSELLSICDILSICAYLDIPSNPAIISGNATGCATRMEVEDECGN